PKSVVVAESPPPKRQPPLRGTPRAPGVELQMRLVHARGSRSPTGCHIDFQGDRMRAARFYDQRDIRVEDVPEPEVTPGMVGIDVAFCGICGTDLHEYLEGP